MSSSFNEAGTAGVAIQLGVIDPADEHFAQSQADFVAYESAINDETKSLAYLVEPHSEQFGGGGNPWSRQGFDFDSFRDRS